MDQPLMPRRMRMTLQQGLMKTRHGLHLQTIRLLIKMPFGLAPCRLWQSAHISHSIDYFYNSTLWCNVIFIVYYIIVKFSRAFFVWLPSVVCRACELFTVCFLLHRYCHVVSLVFNFGYLAFFRIAGYLGFEEVSTGTPNAVQLILSLKVRYWLVPSVILSRHVFDFPIIVIPSLHTDPAKYSNSLKVQDPLPPCFEIALYWTYTWCACGS